MGKTPDDPRDSLRALKRPAGDADPAGVNRRVLHVRGGRSPVLPASLAEEFEVTVAEGPERALELLLREGPYAVVVAEEEVCRDGELARACADLAPGTARLLRVAGGDAAPWLAALAADELQGVVRAADAEGLLESVARSVEEAELERSEGLLVEQLRFTREAMSALTETLEDRLEERLRFLETLSVLGSALYAVETLEEAARVAAEAASRGAGGSAARVVLLGRAGLPRGEAASGVAIGGARCEVDVLDGGEVVGRISLDLRDGSARATRTERHFLDTIASNLAAATAKLARAAERDEAQHATILALARLAESRDAETGRHLERVSAYSRTLATALRDRLGNAEIDDAFVQNIDRSAPLHDIGKVGISDAILLKPGKLDDDEWRVMRTHPEIGARTLAPIAAASPRGSSLRMGLDIAWCHHERWDGRGYPRGLAGEEIPLSARILALADCYDALTTRRPYKEAWTHAAAVAHLRSESGAHFDPRVVEAFEAAEGQLDRIRRELADEPAPA